MDTNSWGPAVDIDNVIGSGNRIAIAFTAYLQAGTSNTDVYSVIGNGGGTTYTWSTLISETNTPNDYEHYPDVAVEKNLGPNPTRNTYAHIVYDEQPVGGGTWNVYYVREP